ncbi:hypothetical protein GFGA_1c1503 [Gluconobacter frateurii NBRC 103465]|nr:hypothetical protein GFGA_1c1503 [Gluconobacter frateurii NBRC 103465]
MRELQVIMDRFCRNHLNDNKLFYDEARDGVAIATWFPCRYSTKQSDWAMNIRMSCLMKSQ